MNAGKNIRLVAAQCSQVIKQITRRKPLSSFGCVDFRCGRYSPYLLDLIGLMCNEIVVLQFVKLHSVYLDGIFKRRRRSREIRIPRRTKIESTLVSHFVIVKVTMSHFNMIVFAWPRRSEKRLDRHSN